MIKFLFKFYSNNLLNYLNNTLTRLNNLKKCKIRILMVNRLNLPVRLPPVVSTYIFQHLSCHLW